MTDLYHHWLSPGARFARIILSEKNIPFRLVLEKEWERRPEFLALNPAGEVPVLVLEDGRVLSGVMALAEFLEESVPTQPLLPGNVDERAEIRRLTGWFHSKFGTEVTRLLVREKLYKRYFKMGPVDSASVRAASHNLRLHLDYIRYLMLSRHYLAGDQFTMADAAAAAHLSVVDYFGNIVWQDWPDVKDWYVRVKSRKSVRGLLTDRISGMLPPAHYSELDF